MGGWWLCVCRVREILRKRRQLDATRERPFSFEGLKAQLARGSEDAAAFDAIKRIRQVRGGALLLCFALSVGRGTARDLVCKGGNFETFLAGVASSWIDVRRGCASVSL